MKDATAQTADLTVSTSTVAIGETIVPINELQARIYLRNSKEDVAYARVIAPKLLRSFLAKTAIWRSLKVKSAETNEGLRTAAAISLGARDFFQEIADQYLADKRPNVVMSNEIESESFLEILAKIEAEEIEDYKKDFRVAFMKPSVQRTKAAGKPANESVPANSETAASAAVEPTTEVKAEPDAVSQPFESLTADNTESVMPTTASEEATAPTIQSSAEASTEAATEKVADKAPKKTATVKKKPETKSESESGKLS